MHDGGDEAAVTPAGTRLEGLKAAAAILGDEIEALDDAQFALDCLDYANYDAAQDRAMALHRRYGVRLEEALVRLCLFAEEVLGEPWVESVLTKVGKDLPSGQVAAKLEADRAEMLKFMDVASRLRSLLENGDHDEALRVANEQQRELDKKSGNELRLWRATVWEAREDLWRLIAELQSFHARLCDQVDDKAAAARTAATDEKPLTRRQRELLSLLDELPIGQGMNGGELIRSLADRGVRGLTQSNLTSRLIPRLRADGWHIQNLATVGYYLSASDRERFAKLRATGSNPQQ